MIFNTNYSTILEHMKGIDPVGYGANRNFIDGAVTHLSPYISRGVLSTKQVMDHVLSLGHPFGQIQKMIQELAWRDYWQQVWVEKKEEIDQDLKREQPDVRNHRIPTAIVEASTGIEAIDQTIRTFYSSGYLHNHVRMYIASIACHVAKSHWKIPAQWMYYHLLDGDWASNALSWQWVSGANSHKKYIANQENINTYCYTSQRNTFLDLEYTDLAAMEEIPDVLKKLSRIVLKTNLPDSNSLAINQSLPTLVYNSYNLDPLWKKEIKANRVLLLEPSHFDKYPVADHVVSFILALSENIPDIQCYVGEFRDLRHQLGDSSIHYKEHPTCLHYQGIREERDWMFAVKGYFPSFFNFWKKCQKEWNDA